MSWSQGVPEADSSGGVRRDPVVRNAVRGLVVVSALGLLAGACGSRVGREGTVAPPAASDVLASTSSAARPSTATGTPAAAGTVARHDAGGLVPASDSSGAGA